MNTDSLNILFIGNSFSECTCAYLYDFFTELGVPSFNVAALKISGCTLNMHWQNAQTDSPSYLFFRYTTSGDRETVSDSYTLKDGISSCQWDWIIFSDGAAGFCDPASAESFRSLLQYVKALATPRKTRFSFNMTWPWEPGFAKYAERFDGSPDVMFHTMVSILREYVLTEPDIACILPNGTAIRKALLTGRAPALYRDGYHLNANGCFLISLTTAYTLLKYTYGDRYDISRCGIPCLPTAPHRTNGSFIRTLEPEYADLYLEAVTAALADPLGMEEN